MPAAWGSTGLVPLASAAFAAIHKNVSSEASIVQKVLEK